MVWKKDWKHRKHTSQTPQVVGDASFPCRASPNGILFKVLKEPLSAHTISTPWTSSLTRRSEGGRSHHRHQSPPHPPTSSCLLRRLQFTQRHIHLLRATCACDGMKSLARPGSSVQDDGMKSADSRADFCAQIERLLGVETDWTTIEDIIEQY